MSDCVTSNDKLFCGTCRILANAEIAASVWRVALEAPRFAALARPGQFLMLRLPNSNDPVLGRPFAVYDADPSTGRVEAVYAVVGKATSRMTALRPGEALELWGPLGNGWDAAKRTSAPKRLALVAGGVGSAPFYLLVKELMAQDPAVRPETTYVFGARSKERLNCVDEFRALGVDVRVATEDGSVGTKGFATDVLPEIFSEELDPADCQIFACGPTPMLRAVAAWSAKRGYDCWTSLESPMACGMGLCYSCVVKWLIDPALGDVEGNWDYRRTCVDGPVFNAARLVW